MKDYLERAINVVPSERQIAWQELEFYAFIHYGMNVFTNREWGTGDDHPDTFNPTELSTKQWVDAIKSAGMRAVILTCKHHDGFCLWPSAYTDYSVKSSCWRDGEGDIVKELSDACKEAGLKFGIYLSPWDRHEPTYGEGEAYNQFFKNQLRELLLNYGDIFCVWFDGACGEGKNGRKQEYDWQGYYKIIRELQPDAVISITGPDVRWCGNEQGFCRKSEWSVVPSYLKVPEFVGEISQKVPKKQPDAMVLDLGSRKVIKKAEELVWYPAEVDVPIRKYWFFHPQDDYSVKNVDKLLKIYYGSVGSNANLLLNLSPNEKGLIPDIETQILATMGQRIFHAFNFDISANARVTATNEEPEHPITNAFSDDKESYWKTTKEKNVSVVIDMGEPIMFAKVLLQEYIRIGQHVENFTIYCEKNKKWKKIYEGTTIGYKKICMIKPMETSKIKIVFEKTRGFTAISKIGVY